jgi:hypothetical protein
MVAKPNPVFVQFLCNGDGETGLRFYAKSRTFEDLEKIVQMFNPVFDDLLLPFDV